MQRPGGAVWSYPTGNIRGGMGSMAVGRPVAEYISEIAGSPRDPCLRSDCRCDYFLTAGSWIAAATCAFVFSGRRGPNTDSYLATAARRAFPTLFANSGCRTTDNLGATTASTLVF